MPPRRRAKTPAPGLGLGLYPLIQSAWLLGERPSTVQRWAFGYHRRGKVYTPAIRTELHQSGGSYTLTFVELIELLFIKAFLKSKLSWPKVRQAAVTAAKLLKDEPHPFATKRWFADAAAIYLKLGEEYGEEILVEVAGHAQIAMEPALRPYLQQIEFDIAGMAKRWFPLGFGTPIVLDPQRSFGAPITSKAGVPTEAIASLHRAGDSPSTIASWFRMEEQEVSAAIEFETQYAGAA